jgi:hypothetical protein
VQAVEKVGFRGLWVIDCGCVAVEVEVAGRYEAIAA